MSFWSDLLNRGKQEVQQHFIAPQVSFLRKQIPRARDVFQKQLPTPSNFQRNFIQPYQQKQVQLQQRYPTIQKIRTTLNPATLTPRIARSVMLREPTRKVISLLKSRQGEFVPETRLEKFVLGAEPIKPSTKSWGAQYAQKKGISPEKAALIGTGLTMAGFGVDVSPIGLGKTQFAKGIAKSKDIGKITNLLRATGKIDEKAIPTLAKKLVNVSDVNKVKRAVEETGRMFPKIAPKVEGGAKVVEKPLTNLEKTQLRVLGETDYSLSKIKPSIARELIEVKLGAKVPTIPKKPPIQPPKPPVAPPKPAEMPGPEIDPVQKVINALKEAKPLRGRQEAIYTKERGVRLAKSLAMGKKITGERGFYAEKGALKGEMSKVQFESIRKQIGQKDIDNLFIKVKDTPVLNEWDKISAREGLAKVFGQAGGAVPTEGELKLLNRVFGADFTKTILDKRGLFEKMMKAGYELANIPRSLMASFDLSAPLRQGIFLIGRPKRFLPAFTKVFKLFGSEKAYKALNEEIVRRPTFKLMQENKLSFTGMDEVLGGREERFMSSWAEKIPAIGKMVRASGRAYTGFLNKIRADVFDDIIRQGEKLGLGKDVAFLQDTAKFVNAATGRGSLGSLERAGVALNSFLFSPRLLASRLNLINPIYYARLHPQVRKEALKSLLGFAGIALATTGIAKMGGASVGYDPRNADFMKIKVGNTRYDILGGFQQPIRLAAQLLSGKIISSTTGRELTLGEGYKPITRLGILGRFFEMKESPVVSFATMLLQGQTSLGETPNITAEIANRFIPMVVQDMYDLYKEEGVKGIGMALPAIFGTGVQTYGRQIPSLGTTEGGKPRVELKPVPGLAEDIIGGITGKQVSNIPQEMWQGIITQKQKETQTKIEKEKLQKALKKDATALGQYDGDLIPFSDGSFGTIENGELKTFKSQSEVSVYQFEKQFGDTATKKAKWELDKQRYKANDNLNGYMQAAENRAKYLEQYITIIEPNTKEYYEAVNSYEDLMAEISKYAGYGGFTKPKKGSTAGSARKKAAISALKSFRAKEYAKPVIPTGKISGVKTITAQELARGK